MEVCAGERSWRGVFGATEETTYLAICVYLSVEAAAGDDKEGSIDGRRGDVGVEKSNGGVAMRQNAERGSEERRAS